VASYQPSFDPALRECPLTSNRSLIAACCVPGFVPCNLISLSPVYLLPVLFRDPPRRRVEHFGIVVSFYYGGLLSFPPPLARQMTLLLQTLFHAAFRIDVRPTPLSNIIRFPFNSLPIPAQASGLNPDRRPIWLSFFLCFFSFISLVL